MKTPWFLHRGGKWTCPQMSDAPLNNGEHDDQTWCGMGCSAFKIQCIWYLNWWLKHIVILIYILLYYQWLITKHEKIVDNPRFLEPRDVPNDWNQAADVDRSTNGSHVLFHLLMMIDWLSYLSLRPSLLENRLPKHLIPILVYFSFVFIHFVSIV